MNCERLPYFVSSGNAAVKGSEFQPGYYVKPQSMGDLSNCKAWNASVGNRNYCIFDDDHQTNVWKFRSAHTAADKGRIPVTTVAGMKSEQFVTCDWVGEFEAAIERGAAFKADTLEELAELVASTPRSSWPPSRTGTPWWPRATTPTSPPSTCPTGWCLCRSRRSTASPTPLRSPRS